MSNTHDNEIKEKILILKELNKELDNFDNLTDILVNNSEDYQHMMQDIHPNERIDLNWNLGFSAYTLYYNYLKLQNIDPRDHEIKEEMKRIQDYYKKIQDAKENVVTSITSGESKINKEASDRILKQYTNRGNIEKTEDNKNTRKLKRSVPIPEQSHLNWEKNIK